jgi:hypothetical protein
MRLRDVRPWNDQYWTQLYEAALFETDKVKLCALMWNAQLAMVGRKQEIKNLSNHDKQELIALNRALGILQDLGRLSGLDEAMKLTLVLARASVSSTRRRPSGSRIVPRTLRGA